MNHRVSKMENGSLHPVPPPENPHRGVVLKATYRQPKLTFEEAQYIAEQAILEQQKQYYPSLSFGPLVLYYEHSDKWCFCSPSPQLIEQGYIPGALFALVDKLAGYVPQPEEYSE
jgi:hypothetical protein